MHSSLQYRYIKLYYRPSVIDLSLSACALQIILVVRHPYSVILKLLSLFLAYRERLHVLSFLRFDRISDYLGTENAQKSTKVSKEVSILFYKLIDESETRVLTTNEIFIQRSG